MKNFFLSLGLLASLGLLHSCEKEPASQAISGPVPVGEPIEVDNWKAVSSDLRELPGKMDLALMTSGFNAVLGPQGSEIELVLNSFFHRHSSKGNLTWEQYEEVRDFNGVEEAYPIAVGDNYRGCRLVGTLPELFTNHEWSKGRKYELQEGGRVFKANAKEALMGALAARQMSLSVGSRFHPYHGLVFDESKRHENSYEVVGLLEPTGTPFDNVIWVPIQGIQQMDGHDPAFSKSVSAVLLSLSGRTGFTLSEKYHRKGSQANLVWPVSSTLSTFLRQTLPAYLDFARGLDGMDPVVLEEGFVVKGKAQPFEQGEGNLSSPEDQAEALPPLEKGSVYKPLAFRDLTNFEYLVEWETDGKDFDFSAYAKRVPSRLREKSGSKVAVEGFMIPTVVDENNKVKEFLLLPDQMSCCFGQAPEANGWVVVTATNGVEVMMDRIIRVTGVLTVEERWDEEFFVGLYHMDCKDITGPAL